MKSNVLFCETADDWQQYTESCRWEHEVDMNSLVFIVFKPCFCGVARETAATQAVMFLSLACVSHLWASCLCLSLA